MRTLRLLTTLLMVMVSMGLCSCSKDFIDEPPKPSIEGGGGSMEDLFKDYLGEDYDNITHLNYNSEKDDTLTFFGLKNKHLWFAYFNGPSKKKLYEWEDIEETDAIQKFYIGYGEYNEIVIGSVKLGYHRKTKVGDIVGFLLFEDTGYGAFHQTIFTSNGKSKRANTKFKYPPIVDYNDWYDESVFIDDTCYSKEGEVIYSIKDSYLLQTLHAIEPVSYEEGIRFSKSSIERFNIKEKKSVWTTSLKDIDIPSDAKVNYTILDKSTKIWKYKLDIVLYDGTKKSVTLKVDIETGKLVTDGIKVAGISLNTTTGKLEIGNDYKLTTTIFPVNATNQNVTWASSDDNVATVDDKGLVTAISEGTTTITVTTEDGNFTAQAIIQVVSSKQIVHIASEDYNISLGYTKGKLSSYIWQYDGGSYEFNQHITYSGSKVVIRGEADGHDCVQTYTLNKDGNATSCTIPDLSGKTIEVTFEYSKEGYLTKAIEISKGGSETRSNVYTFTYSSNGDIIKAKESDITGYIFTQSYDNVKNKAGIIDYAMSELLFNYQAAFYCGILGKPCTHLPNSSKQTETYESNWAKTHDFIYVQDDGGYITKTIIANSQGKAETLTYTYNQ